jgi:hypothetical protein
VSEPPPIPILSILGLEETRRYLRRSHARMMVVFFALLYALGSMVLGGMLILARIRGGTTVQVLWGNALGQGPWNYPGLLIVAPWGVVSLPFLATISMVLVAVGVGIGISVALLIAVRLVRERKQAGAAPGAVGSLAGLTPAMIALVTLGACCSTTAAATAGVGLVAQASGSTLNNLLINNWYLDVFQVVVVFVALLAQEMLLRVYGGLFGLQPVGAPSGVDAAATAPMGLRLVLGGLLRGALLLGGVTWSLAMVAEWTTVSPWSASAAMWFQWIFQHQLLSILAILVALFPSAIISGFQRWARTPLGRALRAALLVGGLSLVTWVPPMVAAAGAGGLLNELFGVWGLTAGWGAVAPVYSPGVALAVRWGLQYLLLGGFGIAVALAPTWALRPIRWTIERSELSPSGRDERSFRSSARPRDRSIDASLGMRSEPAAAVRGIREP